MILIATNGNFPPQFKLSIMKKIFVLATIMFSFFSLNAQVKIEKLNHDSIYKKDSSYVCTMHPKEYNKNPGKCKICGNPLHLSVKEKMKYDVMHPYSCPMHHDQKSAKEGKCPKCGMKMKKTDKHLKEHEEIEKYDE